MTAQELKEAMREGVQVIWRGPMSYDRVRGRITAIITRHNGEGFYLSAEITDNRGNITICRPAEITEYQPEKGN